MKIKLYAMMVLLLLVPKLAAGAEQLPALKVHHEANVSYVSGGIEPLERKALAKMAERYQVQMTFSVDGSDEPVKGVKVTLIDYKGDKAVETITEGPIFFANPPPGRWILQAELDGDKFSKQVDVNGRFYISLPIHFKPAAKSN